MAPFSPREKIKVLVVDDSAFVRRTIIRMFENSADIQIVDVAADGEMAIELIKKLRPDVVTLDVQMPVLDGISALKRIMRESPVPVIMLSSLTGKGGEQTLKALELGAVDFIDKSSAGGPMEFSSLLNELSSKILMAARVDLSKLGGLPHGAASRRPEPERNVATDTEIIVIGISTGGPPALQVILGSLPATFPCPILIVQHMPVGFTASLAERLNRNSRISVKEADDGETPLPGCAYIAPGGRHLTVKRSGTELKMHLESQPKGTLHTPSVDVLLSSAATACGRKALALVLTGMGKDGAVGAQAIKLSGGKVVVEAEESAVVFGMPKAVQDVVAVDGIVHLQQVAEFLINTVSLPATMSGQ